MGSRRQANQRWRTKDQSGPVPRPQDHRRVRTFSFQHSLKRDTIMHLAREPGRSSRENAPASTTAPATLELATASRRLRHRPTVLTTKVLRPALESAIEPEAVKMGPIFRRYWHSSRDRSRLVTRSAGSPAVSRRRYPLTVRRRTCWPKRQREPRNRLVTTARPNVSPTISDRNTSQTTRVAICARLVVIAGCNDRLLAAQLAQVARRYHRTQTGEGRRNKRCNACHRPGNRIRGVVGE